MALAGALIGVPGAIVAQQDPIAADAGKPKELIKPVTIKVVYEVFSLPMKQAAAIQRSGVSDDVFYAKMLAGLKDKSVKQESFLMLRSNSGQKVTGMQAQEYIYPTEYMPAELPNMVANVEKSGDAKKEGRGVFPVTPATPSAYSMKKIGETLDVEATSDAEGTAIQLRISPTRASLIQRLSIGQGVSKLEMPYFANPKLVTGIVTKSGKPSYLGTVSDPIFLQPKGEEQQVFFAFVTATNVSQ